MRFLDNGPRGPKHVGLLLEIFGWGGGSDSNSVYYVVFICMNYIFVFFYSLIYLPQSAAS